MENELLCSPDCCFCFIFLYAFFRFVGFFILSVDVSELVCFSPCRLILRVVEVDVRTEGRWVQQDVCHFMHLFDVLAHLLFLPLVSHACLHELSILISILPIHNVYVVLLPDHLHLLMHT